ncbi:hypothetical protein J2T31_002178 [Kerstersia gyiorum]|nr:hypothetical protein [Kerstersia gyiorum]MCP1823949.1 hypothetical protein [Kerstersia gyiorum]MCP1827390.1 hypothetical protein [Kerstersia gyiorum]MCW2448961.1 hypothetical protein [Kerstersia gyiorum]
MLTPYGGAFVTGELVVLAGVADFVDLRCAHYFECMPTALQLGNRVESDHAATLTQGRLMNQLLFQAVRIGELVVLTHLMGGNAHDLAGTAGQVDQALVAEHNLHFRDALATVVERDQIGMAQRRIGFQAQLRALHNCAHQGFDTAIHQLGRGAQRTQGDLEYAISTDMPGQHGRQRAALRLEEGLHLADAGVFRHHLGGLFQFGQIGSHGSILRSFR